MGVHEAGLEEHCEIMEHIEYTEKEEVRVRLDIQDAMLIVPGDELSGWVLSLQAFLM